MTTAKIASKEPVVLTLEPDTYYWCSCGKSKNQPFCDGSHQGSSFVPVTIEITETKQVALCQCKHSANPPYCDGSHKDL